MKLSVDYSISRAKRYLNNGNYSKARELYFWILREFPKTSVCKKV